MPINTISDMIRTLDNVSTAAVAGVIVAKKTNELDLDVFNGNKNTEEVPTDVVKGETSDSFVSEDPACSVTPQKKVVEDAIISEDQACSFTPKKKVVEESIISEDQACSFTPRKKEL